MSKLSLSVRIAGGSIVVLSLLHIAIWAFFSYLVFATGLNDGQFLPLFLFTCLISAVGGLGVFVGAGILRAQNGARLAALVLGALVALISGFAIVVLLALISVEPSNFGIFSHSVQENHDVFIEAALVYVAVLCLALWWIYLFSRRSVATQFSEPPVAVSSSAIKKPACPPPIALLAWLMIVSSALCAVSWPQVLGKVPVMLFTHIFSAKPSTWIWTANIVLFLACGIGLLRLQRWSYDGAIALHSFWLVSPLVSQLSAGYVAYSRLCLKALNLDGMYPLLDRIHTSPWISAVTTAVPTALLIFGLFYYRRSFLQAAAAKSAS